MCTGSAGTATGESRLRRGSRTAAAGFLALAVLILGDAQQLRGQQKQPPGQVRRQEVGRTPHHSLFDHVGNTTKGRPLNAGVYAARLDSLGYFHSGVRGTDDMQYLDTLESGVLKFNCIGKIWPERNAHRNTELDLGKPEEGGGRITARVWIGDIPGQAAGTCKGYKGFPPGYSYIWVEDLRTELDDNGEPVGRATVIVYDQKGNQAVLGTDDRGNDIKEKTIEVCLHPEYGYRHAHARWMFDEQDARAWWTCVQSGCCNFP